MTESEQLVQRFIDQELSAEERVQFVVRLGRDEAVRRQVIDLERVALDASRLPRPAMPDRFVERVMERTAPVARPAWGRLVEALWAPRALQWNLASATAVCLALVLAGSLIAGRLPQSAAPASGGVDVRTSADSAFLPMVLVRLVVLQPGARTVEVAGDFNGWEPMRTPLRPAEGGAWTVTIPLEPGRYEYKFVVDGQQWVADPFASEHHDDGFGSRNAVLEVGPPMGAV